VVDVAGDQARRWDAVIVGSGFGGAMAAHRLVAAGARVLMIERGDWVPRGPAAWRPEASLEMTPYYTKDIPYRVIGPSHGPVIGATACVGGPSVFYGCVAFRFREGDFADDAAITAGSGAAWPLSYGDLEPYYSEAERLLGVCGDDAGDPTAPRRGSPFPAPPAPLAPVSARLAAAAMGLGLSPFRLPLAINHRADAVAGRAACVACRTCDTYACAIEAKNDVATVMIRPLVARGLALWPRTVALAVEVDGGRARGVRVWRRDGDRDRVEVIAADRTCCWRRGSISARRRAPRSAAT
jgi:choline dehydrogenase-like flavoprotein